MAEVIQGAEFLSFFRLRKEHETTDGAKNRFETESTLSKEKESESTITKDGPVNSIMNGESSAEFTSLAYRDDEETIEIWKKLEEWFDKNELVEFWNVDISTMTKGREIEAVYHQGYFTSFELSMPADGPAELSYTYAINGIGIRGKDTLTEAQLKAVEAGVYDYQKITATGTESV